MPANRLQVRNIREILRLRFEHSLSHRDIGQAVNKSPATVGATLARFEMCEISWTEVQAMDDDQLQSRLYQREKLVQANVRPIPDWDHVDRELRRRDYHVSRHQLWKEYKALHPGGYYEYSWFCHAFEDWRAAADPVMRQDYKFGEKCFVDFTGDTMQVVDGQTGEVAVAQVFVGAMGASSLTYCLALPSQALPYWIKAHNEMFQYFGACPWVLVPDNLRSGVSKAEFYEPAINPTYHEMAKYFSVVVLPTRVRHPGDKAKVEAAVLIVEREIMAPLRGRTFYDFCSLNEALHQNMESLNSRPFQKLPGTRRGVFERDDRPAMQSLPVKTYELGLWRKGRVHIDYHVQVDGHYYSAPFKLVGEAIETRLTVSIVEIYHLSLRVASHVRGFLKGGHTTLPEHMPSNHRWMKDCTPERVLKWAADIGQSTLQAATSLLDRRAHPEQGVRSVLGLLKLAKSFTKDRLEEACKRALATTSGVIYSYKTVQGILEKSLDTLPAPRPPLQSAGVHENVRGQDYYTEAGNAC